MRDDGDAAPAAAPHHVAAAGDAALPHADGLQFGGAVGAGHRAARRPLGPGRPPLRLRLQADQGRKGLHPQRRQVGTQCGREDGLLAIQ